MKDDVKFPPWLTFVSHAGDHDPSLRLTMTNPVNGEIAVFVNCVIEMDEQPPRANCRPHELTAEAGA
jgi:hypothetical protein